MCLSDLAAYLVDIDIHCLSFYTSQKSYFFTSLIIFCKKNVWILSSSPMATETTASFHESPLPAASHPLALAAAGHWRSVAAAI